MSQDDDRVARIVAEADRMIEEIQRQLDAGDDFFREQRIDRLKLLATVGPNESAEAGRLLAEDLAAVEREVEDARARLAFRAPSPGRPPASRMMV